MALAWLARRQGRPVTVLVPPHAPADKLARLRALGARIDALPAGDWWRVVLNRGLPGHPGRYIAADNAAAVAAAGTIGLEIAQQLPEVETVYCAIGSGALACGLWAGISATRPAPRIVACELATATPLTAALAAGKPVDVPFTPSFVSGIGARTVLPSLWPLLRARIARSRVVTLAAVCDVIRLLVERHGLVVEGAAAVAIAAALAAPGDEPRVCLVSGANLAPAALREILAGRIPPAD